MRGRLASAYFVFFMCGWADGITGTVLPCAYLLQAAFHTTLINNIVLLDFEADFHLTYMTSSLLFVASTTGCVLLCFLMKGDAICRLHRFFAATFFVEWDMKFLGTFYLASRSPPFCCHSFFVKVCAPVLRSRAGSCGSGTAHSTSQARFSVLIFASILHSMYFVLLGSKRGFASMLAGYAIAASARAFLTGKC
jgi:hypothetical protein